MMTMNWVDYVLLVVILLSMVTGVMRGLMKEAISLMIWILAFWLAFTYVQPLSDILKPYLHDTMMRGMLSFIAIVLGTVIVGALFNMILSSILKRSGLSPLDRFLGMGFGFVRGVFIVALMILAVNMSGVLSETAREHSQLYPKFEPLVQWLNGFTPTFIHRMKTLDQMDSVSSSS